MWTIAGGILLAVAILIAIPWVFIGLRYSFIGAVRVGRFVVSDRAVFAIAVIWAIMALCIVVPRFIR